MFGNLGISKNSIINTTIKVLQATVEQDPVKDMTRAMSSRILKDEEVQFVVRTYCRKFGVALNNIYIEPIVEPDSLSISEWALYVNGKVAFKANGCQELLDNMTEQILCKDKGKLAETVSTLEKCFA